MFLKWHKRTSELDLVNFRTDFRGQKLNENFRNSALFFRVRSFALTQEDPDDLRFSNFLRWALDRLLPPKKTVYFCKIVRFQAFATKDSFFTSLLLELFSRLFLRKST